MEKSIAYTKGVYTMKVKELIEKLQALNDPEGEVLLAFDRTRTETIQCDDDPEYITYDLTTIWDGGGVYNLCNGLYLDGLNQGGTG
jgi:hypothetical protein